MTDRNAVVGVKQSTDADRNVRNAKLVSGGSTLYEQIVRDDYTGLTVSHYSATSGNRQLDLSTAVRAYRLLNWSTAARLLVKTGSVSGATDSSASRVGLAPTANVPNEQWFPLATTTLHVFSTGTDEVTVEGYS